MGSLLLGMAPYGRPQRLPFRNYTTRDGLVHNRVTTLWQDRSGFLWFGTADGVSRYDGATWVNYTRENGLTYNIVNHIVEDREGVLWIATNHAGLDRFERGRLESHPVDPQRIGAARNRVNVIVPRDDGLWVGTDDGLFRRGPDGWHRLTATAGLVLFAVLEYPERVFWIGAEQGLYRFRYPSRDRLQLLQVVQGAEVHALVRDRHGSVWVGTLQGLRRYSQQGSELALPPALRELRDTGVLSLFIDGEGNLWIGTAGQGVVKYTSRGRVVQYTEDHGLAANYVLDILQDREGNLWFATERGVSKLVGEHIARYTTRDGLPDHLVRRLVQDRRGNLWLGTRHGLALLQRGQLVRPPAAGQLPDPVVLSLRQVHDGRVWVGTRQGVSWFVPSARGFAVHTHDASDGWRGGRVEVIYEDEEQNIWLGHDGGISRWEGDGFQSWSIRPPVPKPLVTAIVRDNQGDLWVGFWRGGIYRMSLRNRRDGSTVLIKKEEFHRSRGMRDDHIRSVWKDRDGHLWFGTRYGGVVRFVLQNGRVRAIRWYTTADGLSSNAVYCIVQDRQGDFWFGTGRGVNRVRIAPDGSPLEVETFPWEGMAGVDVLDCLADASGLLWFATTGGLVRYDPAGEPGLAPPPPVYITRFMVLGQPVAGSSPVPVHLAYNQNSVAFEFVGISFKDEGSVRYQYMLEGLDTTWSPVTDARSVRYIHLPPGRYVFRVRARNVDGVWSEAPAVFAFQIATPYWRTGWFYLLVMTGLLGAVIAAHRYRMRRALEIERVRTRIATDLHDDLGSTLSSISILSEVARREVEPLSQQAAQRVQRIGENARAMLAMLRDIIWAMSPEYDSLDDVVQRIRDYAIEVFESAGIAFTLELPTDHVRMKVPMEYRRNLYLIAKEAIHNAVRHAQCQRARVSITMEDRTYTMVVCDDGIGLRAADRAGNGVRNMKRRAEAMGGTLRIESEPGQGTTVVLRVRLP